LLGKEHSQRRSDERPSNLSTHSSWRRRRSLSHLGPATLLLHRLVLRKEARSTRPFTVADEQPQGSLCCSSAEPLPKNNTGGTQPPAANMASWYSNILTNTKSGITNLQRSVFASEADGDTEDDTHVCRVLRQYYTENGRPLPNWLPPDPKAPPPAPIIQQNSGPAASRYGAAPQQGGGQGGLSSLWDQNRGAGRGAAAAGSRNPFARNAATPDPAPVQARPLPSQRAGSVQSNSVDMGGGGGGGGASSAQDRLRQRLYGGGARTTSPSSSTGPFAPPPQQGGSSRSRGGSTANPGSGDYDPYGPGGQFDSGSGGGGNRYGGGGGLPSGPRRMGGLPSGPRMR
jgi:hypothetical protein